MISNTSKRIFRFTTPERAQRLVSGELYFADINYFRLMEAISGDRVFGDKNERSVVGKLDGLLTDQDLINKPALQKLIGLKPGTLLKMRDTTIIYRGPALILCCSQFASDECERAGNIIQPADFYHTACVEILEPNAIKVAIEEANITYGIKKTKGKVRDFFDVFAGEVRYGEITEQDLRQNSEFSHDGFFKSVDYKEQKEFRFLLSPKGGQIFGDLLIKTETSDGLIIERTPTLNDGAKAELTFDQAVTRLNEICINQRYIMRETALHLAEERQLRSNGASQLQLAIMSADIEKRNVNITQDIENKFTNSGLYEELGSLYWIIRRKHVFPSVDDAFMTGKNKHLLPMLLGAHLNNVKLIPY